MSADGNATGIAYGQIRPNCISKGHLWIYVPTDWLRCGHAAMGRTVLAHGKDGGGRCVPHLPISGKSPFSNCFKSALIGNTPRLSLVGQPPCSATVDKRCHHLAFFLSTTKRRWPPLPSAKPSHTRTTFRQLKAWEGMIPSSTTALSVQLLLDI